ncbi:MAG: serine dehydratase [Bacteroides sp. SM23_62_1]|nr:MAG: serine dehydratase [Bacteroides sp. SM23_62_1]
MSSVLPDYKDIVRAHDLIREFIHRTPVMKSGTINAMFGAEIFFKCENFQKVGAFKFRGATNAIMSLPFEEAQKGVGTHSSGNHAAALSLAAGMRNIPAYIVMPRTAPEIKIKAVQGYGGIITFCEPTLEARESTMKKVLEQTGAAFIPSYNHFKIIAGQGTAAKELLEDTGSLDIVMAPVGGGGLLSGTSISVKAITPEAKVIAVEPANADDAHRSFYSGKIVPSVNPETIADGLLTSLGTLTFAIIREKVDDIVTVQESSIIEAMRMIWERMKIVVEPSGAVPLAALVEKKVDCTGKRVGIILSGGNVDLGKLPFTLP